MKSTSSDVRLAGISKAFAGRTVLDSIDLDVADGELLAMLGPSGCGKTTALRIIAGFESADSGSISIGDRDVTRVGARRRGVGLVFQAYSLFPHLSAEDNVAYGLRVRGFNGARRTRRAAELLDLVGLAEHGAKYPHQLSGGQQQRVALARALAIEPNVLLLDEPLSALDAQVRVQLRDEIRRLQQDTGTTTVIVTHDQEEALTMADRVAVMSAGRIEQIGTPEDVYRRPATAFVSSFVGVINRLPAIVGDDSAVVLDQSVSARTGQLISGSVAEALVRPEDLELVPTPDGSGTITATTLRGAVTSVSVLWRDRTEPVRVDVPSRASLLLSAGQRVDVLVRADHVLLDTPVEQAQEVAR